MALYDIECEQFLGMSHSGAVTEDGTGTVELSDEEVDTLVRLMQEMGTADVEELELEDRCPEIFEKLDDAYRGMAWRAEELHWLWYGYYEDCYEYDKKELKEYCRQNCGIVFEYDEKDFMDDDDGMIDEESLEEEEDDAFRDWLIAYIEGLEHDQAVDFFYDHLNAELEGEVGDYTVEIPSAIVDLAFKDK